VNGAGAGNGLHRSNALLGNGGSICSEQQLGSLAGQRGETGDGQVLMVGIWIVAQNLIGLDNGRKADG